MVAFVLGKRTDETFKKLQNLLAPLDISRFYTDNWGSYERNIPPEKHKVGKANTQKIERKNSKYSENQRQFQLPQLWKIQANNDES